ncbi:MAG TPA: hypothetical protein VFV33_09805, partial [Gemmatimonadaceae bacterium]|nr:hypothetical protein [Gemmatimonadaceae bacterium]
NAVGGGAYGLTGAEAIPRRWLEGSPFTSYVVPSLVLLIVVGGTQLVAAVVVARGAPVGRPASLAAAAILAGWIAVQVAVIGYVSWLQPAMAIAALLEGTLAWWLAPAERGEGR